jgi:hypothetical protein
MSQDHFVNMDAIYLAEVAKTQLSNPDGSMSSIGVRLLQIARNLQFMDDRQGSEYSRGWNDHKNSNLARSNLVKSTSVPVFPNLLEALQNFKGEVQKLPEAGPKQAMKETLTVDDLDL